MAKSHQEPHSRWRRSPGLAQEGYAEELTQGVTTVNTSLNAEQPQAPVCFLLHDGSLGFLDCRVPHEQMVPRSGWKGAYKEFESTSLTRDVPWALPAQGAPVPISIPHLLLPSIYSHSAHPPLDPSGLCLCCSLCLEWPLSSPFPSHPGIPDADPPPLLLAFLCPAGNVTPQTCFLLEPVPLVDRSRYHCPECWYPKD